MKRIVVLFLLTFAAWFAAAQDATPGEVILLRYNGTTVHADEFLGAGPVEWFDIEVPAEGRIEVTAVSVDMDPIISMRRSGTGVEEFGGSGNAARFSRSVAGGERISIGISSGPAASSTLQTAEFTIQVVFRSGGSSLVIGGTTFGDLAFGDEEFTSGSYIDWYPLSVTAGTRVQVSLSSPDFDTYLIVESSDGQTFENDDWDGTDSRVSFVPTIDGIARVGVRSWGSGSTGEYELSATQEQVVFIEVGETYTGEFTGSPQLFTLRGVPDQIVDVEAYSFVADTTLTIEDSAGAYLYNDDSGNSSDSYLLYVIGPGGTATITVDSFGGTGEFGLRVSESRQTVDNPADGYQLTTGESVTGWLLSSSPQLDGVFYQRFTFYADEGERVEITLESDSFDSYLRLVDPRGFEMTDDDSAGDLNSRITYVVERSGMHEVYATPLGGGTTGVYTLSFRTLGTAREILSTRGQLTPNDLQENGKSYDVYTFTASANSNVAIDVMSDSFDTMISLRDRSGTILAQDDDGGGGSNSRIEFVPQSSGTYEVWVTSFSSQSYGNYTVSIYE